MLSKRYVTQKNEHSCRLHGKKCQKKRLIMEKLLQLKASCMKKNNFIFLLDNIWRILNLETKAFSYPKYIKEVVFLCPKKVSYYSRQQNYSST